MKKDVNKTLIGAFIVGAMALLAAGILVLGGGRLFEKSDRYVLYFSGSVKGLGTGAPVQLKGVTMGQVTGINLVYNPEKETFLNRVTFEVTEGAIKIAGGSANENFLDNQDTLGATIDRLIEDGLRAKLKIQSFVTGQLLVAFDFYPNSPIHLVGINDDLRELPTLPSDLEELAKTVDALDLGGLVDTFTNVAGGIDELVNSTDMKDLAANANQTLAAYRRLAASLESEATETLAEARRFLHTTEAQIPAMALGVRVTTDDLRKTVANLDQRMVPALATIEAAAASAKDAFQQADTMLGNMAYLSGGNSTIIYRIDETLAETRKAARALATLAEYLNRHPEALLRGKQVVGVTK